MIICDGKHKKQTPGQDSIVLQGPLQIDGLSYDVKFALVIHGKHFCRNCFAEHVKKIDLSDMIKAAQGVKTEG